MPVTKYIWDGQNCLMETDGTGTVQTVYTYEPEQYGNLISSRVSGTTYYHHYDALGSTRQLSNAAGPVSDTWIYDAWGNTVARTGATAIFLQWVGQVGYYYDPETGTFWVRERPLEPSSARWTTADPAEFISGLNRHMYAKNCPAIYSDPSGFKETKTCHLVIYAGHYLPGARVDEIDKILRKHYEDTKDKGLPCGEMIGGVGCFPEDIQQTIEDLFGEDVLIPGLPTGPVVDGYLRKRDAPKMLTDAYWAAVKQVKKSCKKKCCDQVRIVIKCTPDMQKAIKEFGNAQQQKLCDTSARGAGAGTKFQNVFEC